MLRLRLLVAAMGVFFVSMGSIASAQTPGTVAIVEVRGLLDQALVGFVAEAISDLERAGTQVVILELNSSGATTADVYGLIDLLSDPPVPVAVWVGAAPAQAFGAAGQLLAAAPISAAAPGVEVGYLSPTVAGADDERPLPGPENLYSGVLIVEEPVAGLIDVVEPALPQLVAALDGLEVDVQGETVTLSTVTETVTETGETLIHPVETRFLEPGLGVRVLRTGLSPDAAFFLLVIGLSVVAFEFYALGPGVAAAVAALSLLLASYGLANLPLRWWAVAATLLGILALLWQFQLNARVGWRTIVGLALLLVGGLALTDGAPQFAPTWWVTVLSVTAASFFFIVALPAVTRARLSTPTIGRSHLVGISGNAASDFVDGSGTAEVDGARWRASSHREAKLKEGDDLRVTGVDGTYLLVDVAEAVAHEASQKAAPDPAQEAPQEAPRKDS